MNDTRTVPAGGVSDEEIQSFLSDQWNKNGWDIDDIDLIRAALARWGAQTEFDPASVEALVRAVKKLKRLPEDEGIDRSIAIDNAWVDIDAALADLRSSRRPKGRVVEGWALLTKDGGFRGVSSFRGYAETSGALSTDRIVPCRIEILDAPEEG